ncbi:MAG: methyltransferase domain-containing protein [Planctomycetia bacterium]|nr:methyltransferase domain-containing protein [Planctomycetia bacterium]
MGKHNEIEYALRMNAAHATNKPFSDSDCGRNLIRLGTIFTLLPPPPARLLDLGCGTGWTSRFFARAGYSVVGVDIAPEMIRLAEAARDQEGLTDLSFAVSDYEQLNFRDEFDCCVFFDSLHHAEDERLAIQRAFQAIKPGGVCIADEPGEGHSHSDETLQAVAHFGVTEKDMPPAHVVALGQSAGFREFKVFPPSDELAAEVYARRATPSASPFSEIAGAPELAARVPLWRRAWRGIAMLFDRGIRYPAWRLTTVDHLLLHIRANGLVLMRKPNATELRAAA